MVKIKYKNIYTDTHHNIEIYEEISIAAKLRQSSSISTSISSLSSSMSLSLLFSQSLLIFSNFSLARLRCPATNF